MLTPDRSSIVRTGIALALTGAAVLLTACRFDPTGLVSPSTDRARFVAVDDADRLHAMHGRSCVEPIRRGGIAIVDDTLHLPDWANEATVFLNGWRLAYREKHHNVAALGVTLANVSRPQGLLTWQATAVISDKKFNDAYLWCYHYTAIAWNREAIQATPAYLAAANELEIENLAELFTGFADGNTTALKARFRRVEFRDAGPVAVLPMGIGFRWAKSDRRLLQASYHLDGPSRFLEAGRRYVEGIPELDASQANAAAITWVTRAIFRDNKVVRDYDVAELVSLVTGPDIGLLTPPYATLPTEKLTGFGKGCIGPTPGERVHDVAIENVGFEYAFPVLTGWNVQAGCEQTKVREIAVRIDTLSYELSAGQGGTLRYRFRSNLANRHGSGHVGTHRVSILGFGPVGRQPPAVRIVSPVSGTTAAPAQPVRLRVEATASDGELPDTGIRWFSDIDGFLGAGAERDAVLTGPTACEGAVTHVLRAEATDQAGNRASDQVIVSVVRIC